MAEDRDARVEAAARALRKLEPDDEGQSWREHYVLKVPSGEGWREYVPMARAVLAAADAVSGAAGERERILAHMYRAADKFTMAGQTAAVAIIYSLIGEIRDRSHPPERGDG